MKTVEFLYDIGQPVLVNALGMNGVIDGLSYDINGLQYRVVYWNEGIRYQTWMYSWEIDPVRAKRKEKEPT